MKRIILMLTVAAFMVAAMTVSVVPVFADTVCKGNGPGKNCTTTTTTDTGPGKSHLTSTTTTTNTHGNNGKTTTSGPTCTKRTGQGGSSPPC